MTEKLYKDMATQEQLRWLAAFSSFEGGALAALEKAGRVSGGDDTKSMEDGLRLIAAFPYARDFVATSLRFQDYDRRLTRLRYYVERIKKDVSRDLVVQGRDGEMYAYIPQLQGQSRRRGRPTREETIARAMSEKDNTQAERDEVEKEKRIARLAGLEIVTATPGREKNNDELAAERKAQDEERQRQQTSLFADVQQDVSSVQDDVDELKDQATDTGDRLTAIEGQIEQLQQAVNGKQDISLSSSLPRLSDIKWMLSPDLAAEVDNIRTYRAQAAAAAEKAKTMAEMGAKAEDVAPHATEAAVNVDSYEKVFERVDGELAALYVRLREDEPFIISFKAKWGFKDLTDILHLLKPYYNKQDEGFADRVRKVIAEENPEAVAKREQERQVKTRVDAIVKYLMRKDKKATAQRVKTMEARIKELEELRGREFADVYRPLLDKAREEVEGTAKEETKE